MLLLFSFFSDSEVQWKFLSPSRLNLLAPCLGTQVSLDLDTDLIEVEIAQLSNRMNSSKSRNALNEINQSTSMTRNHVL